MKRRNLILVCVLAIKSAVSLLQYTAEEVKVKQSLYRPGEAVRAVEG
jgi:hypothetical protein